MCLFLLSFPTFFFFFRGRVDNGLGLVGRGLIDKDLLQLLLRFLSPSEAGSVRTPREEAPLSPANLHLRPLVGTSSDNEQERRRRRKRKRKRQREKKLSCVLERMVKIRRKKDRGTEVEEGRRGP